MTIRPVLNPPVLIDGLPFIERIAKPILYSTAYPFRDAKSPVVFGTHFGRNGAVTTEADAWPQGGLRTFPSAGFTIGVSSSSAVDTAAGTGARTIEIDYLDTSYALKTISLSLAGQTKVTATVDVSSVLRINGVRVTSFGSGGTNAGTVYVYDASDTLTAGVPQTATKIFNTIPVGGNICKSAFFSVPAGCRMLILSARAGFDDATVTSRAAVVSMYVSYLLNGGRLSSVVPIVGQIGESGGPANVRPEFPMLLEEKSDFSARVSASASSPIAVFFDFILYHK
jgi:hypothetical protein